MYFRFNLDAVLISFTTYTVGWVAGWVVGKLESNAKLNSKLRLKLKLKLKLSLAMNNLIIFEYDNAKFL